MTHRTFDLFVIATNPCQAGRRTSSCYFQIKAGSRRFARIDQVRTQQISPVGSFFAPAVNTCRLETKVEGGPKIRVYIWEANAGWIVWSDDAVDALMKASANR